MNNESTYTPSFPRVIRIEPAASCNFKCIHCPTGQNMSPTGVMTPKTFNKITADIEQIISEQKRLLRVIVLYHGGEPLLNKHFIDMVIRSKKLANMVKTVTNGSHLSDEIINQIIDSGLDHIEISLDGTSEEENNKIRLNPVGANFRSISKKIIHLIKKRQEKGSRTPRVFISNTQIPETAQEAIQPPQPPRYLLEAFRDVSEKITYKCNWSLVWPSMPIKIQGKPDFNHCDHVINTITIRSNGDVVACCYDLVSKLPMGNIYEQSLNKIWNDKRYQNIRKAIDKFSPPGLCKGCPVLYKFQPMTKSDIFPKK